MNGGTESKQGFLALNFLSILTNLFISHFKIQRFPFSLFLDVQDIR